MTFTCTTLRPRTTQTPPSGQTPMGSISVRFHFCSLHFHPSCYLVFRTRDRFDVTQTKTHTHTHTHTHILIASTCARVSDSSNRVLIENSVVHAGDDCVVIKSGKDAACRAFATPSANILVRNVTLDACSCFKVCRRFPLFFSL